MEEKKNTMENKKPHGFCVTPDSKCTMNYCDDNGCVDRKRRSFEEGELTASGSVAAPKEEIVRVLRVAKRFVSEGADMLIDTDNQEAQSEFRAAEKECQRLITKLTDGEKRERDEYEKNINEMVNRIFDAERKEKEYLKSLQSENTALREALKELLPLAEHFNIAHIKDDEWMDRKAIIEKARNILSK